MRFHLPVLYSKKDITQFENQPIGTAIHTICKPKIGANAIATNTRINRFTKFATVNIFISPAPRKSPSTAILNPIKQKNHPIKLRYPQPVFIAVIVPSSPRNIDTIKLLKGSISRISKIENAATRMFAAW